MTGAGVGRWTLNENDLHWSFWCHEETSDGFSKRDLIMQLEALEALIKAQWSRGYCSIFIRRATLSATLFLSFIAANIVIFCSFPLHSLIQGSDMRLVQALLVLHIFSPGFSARPTASTVSIPLGRVNPRIPSIEDFPSSIVSGEPKNLDWMWFRKTAKSSLAPSAACEPGRPAIGSYEGRRTSTPPRTLGWNIQSSAQPSQELGDPKIGQCCNSDDRESFTFGSRVSNWKS